MDARVCMVVQKCYHRPSLHGELSCQSRCHDLVTSVGDSAGAAMTNLDAQPGRCGSQPLVQRHASGERSSLCLESDQPASSSGTEYETQGRTSTRLKVGRVTSSQGRAP